jgi:hypothetical protein
MFFTEFGHETRAKEECLLVLRKMAEGSFAFFERLFANLPWEKDHAPKCLAKWIDRLTVEDPNLVSTLFLDWLYAAIGSSTLWLVGDYPLSSETIVLNRTELEELLPWTAHLPFPLDGESFRSAMALNPPGDTPTQFEASCLAIESLETLYPAAYARVRGTVEYMAELLAAPPKWSNKEQVRVDGWKVASPATYAMFFKGSMSIVTGEDARLSEMLAHMVGPSLWGLMDKTSGGWRWMHSRSVLTTEFPVCYRLPFPLDEERFARWCSQERKGGVYAGEEPSCVYLSERALRLMQGATIGVPRGKLATQEAAIKRRREVARELAKLPHAEWVRFVSEYAAALKEEEK